MNSYETFLANKRIIAPSVGMEVEDAAINPALFPFQRDLVRWALRKGRAAIFADTGLGKTIMQLEWADHAANHTNGRALILAPLAVAKQTVAEGERFGITVTYCRNHEEAPDHGIVITNYEMLYHFNQDDFGAVVLDESSILKSYDSKTKAHCIDAFRHTPMRLACTATPAPNDIAELANHAEFLGVTTRAGMLSMFFVNGQIASKGDKAGWRLKGHARSAFFRWLASWSMALKKPSDIGYSDEGYILPKLHIHPVRIEVDFTPPDRLFFSGLKGITDRSHVRHGTIDERVGKAVDLVKREPGEQWLIWCGLNDEGAAIKSALKESGLPTIEVQGSDTPEYKAESLIGFANGGHSRMISKPRIAGFGMNFQKCARMLFLGIGDSYEQYYQSIRRCWRFGQSREVHAYIVYTDAEEDIYANVLRKEHEAERMTADLIAHVQDFEREELAPSCAQYDMYTPTQEALIPAWLQS